MGITKASFKGKHFDITEQIIGAFYDVYNQLGFGFLEKVYENALAIELKERGHNVRQQFGVLVRYRGQIVGEYFADLVIDEKVLVEVKSVRKLLDVHEAQLLNYLKATPYEVGLLLNFGREADVQRRVYDNDKKPNLRQN